MAVRAARGVFIIANGKTIVDYDKKENRADKFFKNIVNSKEGGSVDPTPYRW